MNKEAGLALLQGLVAIPSLSQQEAAASVWLTTQMQALGYDRAFVDGAGNAVGELGPVNAARTILLLGHIDTVPGAIPVRVEETPDGAVLYGRGSVDAKGPLATATAAAARVGSAWAHEHTIRLVVVGAVEEEAASSKGARFIRDRFDGVHEPVPEACIIGEPSGWGRVTLGYKGRVLVEMEAMQPMAHTAGPDAGVATAAVDFWQWLDRFAATCNAGVDKIFDQVSPSLRRLATFTDEQMLDHVVAQAGIRLPLGFDIDAFTAALSAWAHSANTEQQHAPRPSPLAPRPPHLYWPAHHPHLAPQRLRSGLAQRAQQRTGAELSGRNSHHRSRDKTWVRGQKRHQRHERGGACLALPDPGLRAGGQQFGSHAPRACGCGRVLARGVGAGGRAAGIGGWNLETL